MVIDTLGNAAKYFLLHPSFEKAFAWIGSIDFATIEPGKYEIDGDALKGIISDAAGKNAEASVAKFECHNQYIDIQVCIRGVETIGWKPREKCVVENGGYNAEKDVQLYTEQPDMYFQLTDGQFVVFFPNDVHAPMIGEGNIKKIVVKVKI